MMSEGNPRESPSHPQTVVGSLKRFVAIYLILFIALTGYNIWRTMEKFHQPGGNYAGRRCGSGNPHWTLRHPIEAPMFLISKLRPSSSNIFLVTTTCDSHRPGILSLSKQQACSIYSTASQNPSRKVILLCSCPVAKEATVEIDDFIQSVLDLPNFHLVPHQLARKWFEKAIKELMLNVTAEVSYDGNLMKFLIVYFFGGTLMEMDSINVRSLDDLGTNFLSAKSEYSFGESLFNFEPKHQLLKELLMTMFINNRTSTTAYRTSDPLTSVLTKFCSRAEIHIFDTSHNLLECNLQVLATDLTNSRKYGPSPEILMNGTRFACEPYGPRVHNQTEEKTLQIVTNSSTRVADVWLKNASDFPKLCNDWVTQHCAAVCNATKKTFQYSTGSIKHGIDLTTSAPQEDKILTLRNLSPSNDNLFFLETTCAPSRKLRPNDNLQLSVQQACAIQSAAHHNPSKRVTLIYTCKGFVNMSSGLVNKLLDLPNFHLVMIDLKQFYARTLDPTMTIRLREESEFPGQHNADMLRLLILYNYGGTYVDLDTITLRPLDDLGTNFIGAENYQFVTNGVLNFEAKHKVIEKCIDAAPQQYRASSWQSIGSLLMSSVLLDPWRWKKSPIINWTDWKPLEEKRHFNQLGITVLPYKTFYAIPYWKFDMFYNDSEWPSVQSELQQSYVAHFWNHMGSRPVNIYGEQPVAKLADLHCRPIVDYAKEMGCFFLE